MAASVRPNQMMAAGTQATDGRLCSPLTIGPIAARSHRLHHMASPSSVPTTSDSANPSPPRLRLVQIAFAARPSVTASQNTSPTCAGEGSAYGGLISETYASCQTPTSAARKTSGGRRPRTSRLPRPGPGGGCAASSRASRPASTDRVATSSARVRGRELVAMAADLLVQLAGDVGRERADPGGLDRPRLGQVHAPL